MSIQDFSPEEIKATLELALLMKRHPNDFLGALAGKQMVMFFEKPSLRTRLTFRSGNGQPGRQRDFHGPDPRAASTRAKS